MVSLKSTLKILNEAIILLLISCNQKEKVSKKDLVI
jgi:hypothetical protein